MHSDFEAECLYCRYKDASPSEGWCYMFKDAPVEKCIQFTPSNSTLEGIAIHQLQTSFPDVFDS